MLNDFINNAKGLTRNPLGIIALFVSLIYGFACLVLSTSISNLHTSEERLPLIWFIIVFPIIILIAFISLVIKHHEKLYSPSDYRGDEAFIQTIDKHKLKEKQLKEVKELENAKVTITETKPENKVTNEENTNVNVDSKETSNSERTSEKTESELLEIYRNSEKWASQELSLKYNILFKTNVSFSIQSGKVELDAFGKDNERTYIAEIKYWQANKSDKKLKLSIQEFLSKHKKLESTFKRSNDFKFIIVLVFDSLKNINKNEYLTFVKSIYENSNVEFFEYEELKKNYE